MTEGEQYLPNPYKNFEFMRRAIYDHLFPLPVDDCELSKVLEAEPDEKQARFLLGAVRKGNFDPILRLFPPHRIPPRHRTERGQIVFPPHWLTSLSTRRWHMFLQTSRDALYEGRLKSFHFSVKHGIRPIENRNLWLDDTTALEALEWGRIDPFPENPHRDPPKIVDILFDGDELARLFPPFRQGSPVEQDAAAQPPKRGRKLKWPIALEILREIRPTGRLPSDTNASLLREVHEHTDITFSEGTFNEALKEFKTDGH